MHYKSIWKHCQFQIHLSNAIWLLFSESQDVAENWIIPIDSEFLIASQQLNGVVLSEVYRVSPSHPLQFRNFFIQNTAKDLSCSAKSLYQRRSDLKGLIFRTGILDVSITYSKHHEHKYIGPIQFAFSSLLLFISLLIAFINYLYLDSLFLSYLSSSILISSHRSLNLGLKICIIYVYCYSIIFFSEFYRKNLESGK